MSSEEQIKASILLKNALGVIDMSQIEELNKIEEAMADKDFQNRSNDVELFYRFKTFKAKGPGGEFVLTRKECMVMKYLIERAGEVVSRDQLLDAVWGYHTYPTNRTIDNFILKLRKIFEDDPKNADYIETIRGVGYRFTRQTNE